jgi:excinuclease ABC subunit A
MAGLRTGPGTGTSERDRALRDHSIRIHHAREHNLQNIDVRIPHERFTVITGVSGSGKSTVAFDIVFAEGQRRYLESLNAYARQLMQPASRPDVDGVFGISPTVAIEQRSSRGGRKSTVATMTEIYHFFRLLFTKLGVQYCPECNVPIQPQTREAILARVLQTYGGKSVELYAPLVTARKGYYTDLAKWASKKGFVHLRVDGILVPTRNWPRLSRFREHSIELPIGGMDVSARSASGLRQKLDMALDLGGGIVYAVERAPEPRASGRGEVQSFKASEIIYSTQRNCPTCGRSFEEPDPRLFSFNSKHGWCPLCYGTGLQLAGFDDNQTGEEIWWTDWWEGPERLCPACNGLRLRPEALGVRLNGHSIIDLTKLTVAEAEDFFLNVKLSEREGEVAHDILAEICSRVNFLNQVGLPYLTLDRAAPTLSGGEAQRIRLASQLGSNLRGVCYILDEPTIGLHARDNRMLLDTLYQLKAKGNTVVVVEHDEETIRQAEWIVDLGPGGGNGGGNLVYEGTLEQLVKSRSSLTGKYLRKPLRHPLRGIRRPLTSGEEKASQYPQIEIGEPHLHNLKDGEVKIPLGKLVCVTGVSGSGKSSLVQEVLYENLRHLLVSKRTEPVQFRGCSSIKNWETVERVLEVDQTPIGKTPRSCPATYVGFWNDIRKLFATIPEAKMRGYDASRFSFNVAGGRCDVCAGQGIKKIKMSFLPDVRVICEACGGKRFSPQTLAVRFKDKNIGEILAMSVDEAIGFFGFHPKIHHALSLLQDVGLGYLTLGQQSPTLSGGEAQRIKLVSELTKSRLAAHCLYVMDEPTIGLHMGDVEKLIRVLHRLVDAGNTVIIIEHNLDIIAEADWIIDLGPEGGDRGGQVVARGTPEEVSRVKRGSYTAIILAQFLKNRSSPEQSVL